LCFCVYYIVVVVDVIADEKIRVVVAPAADIVVFLNFIGGVRTVVKLLAWLMVLL
jgi:hypothetical protein